MMHECILLAQWLLASWHGPNNQTATHGGLISDPTTPLPEYPHYATTYLNNGPSSTLMLSSRQDDHPACLPCQPALFGCTLLHPAAPCTRCAVLFNCLFLHRLQTLKVLPIRRFFATSQLRRWCFCNLFPSDPWLRWEKALFFSVHPIPLHQSTWKDAVH